MNWISFKARLFDALDAGRGAGHISWAAYDGTRSLGRRSQRDR